MRLQRYDVRHPNNLGSHGLLLRTGTARGRGCRRSSHLLTRSRPPQLCFPCARVAWPLTESQQALALEDDGKGHVHKAMPSLISREDSLKVQCVSTLLKVKHHTKKTISVSDFHVPFRLGCCFQRVQ